MAGGRSLFKEMFKNFLNSINPKQYWGEFKGKDHHGTEYYEGKVNYHTKKPRRWFIPVDRYEFKPDIPIEWQAWLRHKRKDPPTEEEIQLNIQKMMSVIEKAKKLEMQRKKTVDGTENMKGEFPKYKEYDADPFTNQEKNIKF